MKRVLVIGGYGAGKTVFAQRLHQASGIPLHQLDDLYWQHAESGKGREDWLRTVDEIASRDAWIIDGNYGGTIDLRLRRADAVIFFDYSPLRCLIGILRRVAAARLGLNRENIIAGCNDRIDRKILRSVLTFRKRQRDGILSGVRKHPQIRLVVFRKPGDAERFFAELSRSIRQGESFL